MLRIESLLFTLVLLELQAPIQGGDYQETCCRQSLDNQDGCCHDEEDDNGCPQEGACRQGKSVDDKENHSSNKEGRCQKGMLLCPVLIGY